MAIMKSEQILSDSTKSFEDAIQTAVTRFSRTVRGVKSANVNNMSAVVEDGKIVSYRVNLQVTFEVEELAGTAEARNGKKKKKK
jgi:flavin-binding protein dodecin